MSGQGVTADTAETAQNVASQLARHARERPHQAAVIERAKGRREDYICVVDLPMEENAEIIKQVLAYHSITYAKLHSESMRVAAGLIELGVRPGDRIALMVRPGIDFVMLVFAIFQSGAVAILIDPGMGRKNLLACLSEAKPDGFIALPIVHMIRMFCRKRFPQARFLVTVGRRYGWGGVTLRKLQKMGAGRAHTVTAGGDDPAAIIFTTGSTGVPKGVLYAHRQFVAQVEQLRHHYQLQPGGIDLAGFPLFGLFNSGLGVTTVVPDMDATRPADIDPQKFLDDIERWKVTQSFGSPALWNTVTTYCEKHDLRIRHVQKVFSAGAPVPGRVLERLQNQLSREAQIHTPYGATEALPVASITASEVLGETQSQTDRGGGVCVGKRFADIHWRVIPIRDAPLDRLPESLPAGQIGELVVSGPVVTTRYVTRQEVNRWAKIDVEGTIWHRMGDVGYLDQSDGFWFCGRMAHRVQTEQGTLYTVPCEAVFNTHKDVYRSALIGLGPAGRQRPVLVVEPFSHALPSNREGRQAFIAALAALAAKFPHTTSIRDFLFHADLPVDIRHNAKIFREKLVPWAERKLRCQA
ncbi:MAG: fatty acid CoA ligase family protein [Planctomycetota bacterium]|nr:fatty acid CoA ligase family protein [Planctomycetota bacterium]